MISITDYEATLEIIRGYLIGQGRRAQFVDEDLVIGVKQRVSIRVTAIAGTPFVHARTTSHDAIGDLLGVLVGLDIHIPERRAALHEIRRALERASCDGEVPKPKVDSIDCGDALDCAEGVGDCLNVVDLVSSCDVPDLGCDLGCI
jgi:hypothetical protein